MEYVLSSIGRIISTRYETLDDAMMVAMAEDGRHYIQVFSAEGGALGRYGIEVANGSAVIHFKGPKRTVEAVGLSI